MGNIAVYGLSGDPITNGHRWVVQQASQTYDKVYVVLAANAAKSYAFPPLERLMMARHLATEFPNVEAMSIHDELLVRKAKELGATVLLRGVRNKIDTDYEEGIRLLNDWLDPTVRTEYVYPPGHREEKVLGYGLPRTPEDAVIRFVSSSIVKGLVGLKGWEEYVAKMVPEYVMPFLRAYAERKPK